jgi:glutaminyl-tRNA synthetase
MDESPDTHPDKDFMELLNPESLKIIEAYVEPSLKDSKLGERFQFQRLGYFNVDEDSTPNHLVFNKTVGLRDSWEKKKPVENQNQNKQQKPVQPQRKAIDLIQQLGKKYTNLPEAKQQKAKKEIQELAKNVQYEELSPLFETATKKTGTRIAVLITLKALLKSGLNRNQDIDRFIEKALSDSNELLVSEAKSV